MSKQDRELLILIGKLPEELQEENSTGRDLIDHIISEAKKEERGKIWRNGEVFELKSDCINFIDKERLNPDCKVHKILEHGVHYPYYYCPMSCYLYLGKANGE